MFLFHLPPSRQSCLFSFPPFFPLFQFPFFVLRDVDLAGYVKCYVWEVGLCKPCDGSGNRVRYGTPPLKGKCYGNGLMVLAPFLYLLFCSLPLLCNASLTSETFSISFCIFYLSLFPAKLYYAILNLTQQPVRRYSFSTYLVMSLWQANGLNRLSKSGFFIFPFPLCLFPSLVVVPFVHVAQ